MALVPLSSTSTSAMPSSCSMRSAALFHQKINERTGATFIQTSKATREDELSNGVTCWNLASFVELRKRVDMNVDKTELNTSTTRLRNVLTVTSTQSYKHFSNTGTRHCWRRLLPAKEYRARGKTSGAVPRGPPRGRGARRSARRS